MASKIFRVSIAGITHFYSNGIPWANGDVKFTLFNHDQTVFGPEITIQSGVGVPLGMTIPELERALLASAVGLLQRVVDCQMDELVAVLENTQKKPSS